MDRFNNEKWKNYSKKFLECHKEKNQIFTMNIETRKENSVDWLESKIVELFTALLKDNKEDIKHVEDIKEVEIKMTFIRDKERGMNESINKAVSVIR